MHHCLAVDLPQRVHITIFDKKCYVISVTPQPGARVAIRFVVVGSDDPTIGKLVVPSELKVMWTAD